MRRSWRTRPTALVVVDVNRPSYTEEPRLLNLVKTIVVIDHHRQSSEIISNATLSYVEPYASSACELVAEILQYVTDSIRIKSLEADAMYAGYRHRYQQFHKPGRSQDLRGRGVLKEERRPM